MFFIASALFSSTRLVQLSRLVELKGLRTLKLSASVIIAKKCLSKCTSSSSI